LKNIEGESCQPAKDHFEGIFDDIFKVKNEVMEYYHFLEINDSGLSLAIAEPSGGQI